MIFIGAVSAKTVCFIRNRPVVKMKTEEEAECLLLQKNMNLQNEILREISDEPPVFPGKLTGLPPDEQEQCLWESMTQLQGMEFVTPKGLHYTYSIKGREMFADRKEKSITQATVFAAFRRILELGGGEHAAFPVVVSGPKKLGTFGASYLYPVFVRIGVIIGKSSE